MAECVFSWGCIIAALVTEDPLWAIASALFAIASNLIDITKASPPKFLR